MDFFFFLRVYEFLVCWSYGVFGVRGDIYEFFWVGVCGDVYVFFGCIDRCFVIGGECECEDC